MTQSENPLWRWPALCEALNLPACPGPDIHQITIDSRHTDPGDLFIALSGDPGPRFHSSGSSGLDGHDFIAQAIQAGAAGVLLSRDMACDVPSLKVDDTLEGLWAIGATARHRMQGLVTGITGSSGKTTARQWLEQLLRMAGRTHASVGSFNNHWGVPLSLARMPEDSEFGVFEIGMNNPGEIAPLSELVNMDVAVVLNVLPAHLGRFEHIGQIREEKLSIARGLKPGGRLVLPQVLAASAPAGADIVTFGFEPDATVRGSAHYTAQGAEVSVQIAGQQLSYRLTTGGEHRVQTSLSCLAVIHALGLEAADFVGYMPDLTTPQGRGNRLQAGRHIIIDDSYNANPVSMRYALQELAVAGDDCRKIAVLGEMLELGDDGIQMHRDIAQHCRGIDGVITVGEGFRDAGFEEAPTSFLGHFASADDIPADWLDQQLGDKGVLLVKGSNRVFWTRNFVNRLVTALAENGQ